MKVNSVVSNRHILGFCTVHEQEDLKTVEYDTVRVRCDTLSFSSINFDSHTLEKLMRIFFNLMIFD